MPELQLYMKHAWHNDAQLGRAKAAFDAVKQRWKDHARKSAAAAAPPGDAALFALVPARAAMDDLAAQYFDTIEQTHRILHRPTFEREYAAYWADGGSGRTAGFAAVLCLVSACTHVQACAPPWRFVGASSVARHAAAAQVEAAEAWMARQSRKHVGLRTFQLRALAALARVLNEVKAKQLWLGAGTLLRQAVAAGMHRDPARLAARRFGYKKDLAQDPTLPGGGLSPFDWEMRRRLWTTIVELDLQASYERGLASSTVGYVVDSGAPLNVEDGEVDPDMESAPGEAAAEAATDCLTPTLYQHLSHRSLPLRIDVNAALNDTTATLTLEDILRYEREILRQIDAVRHVRDLRAPGGGGSGPALLQSALLELQLRALLLSLHDSTIYHKHAVDRGYSAFRSADAACRIIDLHGELLAAGYHFIGVLRNDVFRAATSLCYNIRSQAPSSSSSGPGTSLSLCLQSLHRVRPR